MHAPVRTRFATDDPDLAHAHITRAYGDHRLRLGRPRGAFRYVQDRVDLGTVHLDRVRQDSSAGYTLAPTGLLVVVRVRAGRVQSVVGGQERRLGPGDVYLAAPPDVELLSEVFAGTAVEATSVDPALLAAVDPQRAAVHLDRFRTTPLDPRAAAVWNRSTAHLRSVLDAPGPEGPSPLLLGAHGRLLAATLLELFALDAPDRTDDVRPASLRRVVSYIEANADLDLTPADLAEVGGVGVRALQLAFRKHLGTTPMGYLRRVRLDQVHADLLAADPARDTVTRIAAGWGFTDPSRFAARYRQTYGRPPSDTLHA